MATRERFRQELEDPWSLPYILSEHVPEDFKFFVSLRPEICQSDSVNLIIFSLLLELVGEE